MYIIFDRYKSYIQVGRSRVELFSDLLTARVDLGSFENEFDDAKNRLLIINFFKRSKGSQRNGLRVSWESNFSCRILSREMHSPNAEEDYQLWDVDQRRLIGSLPTDIDGRFRLSANQRCARIQLGESINLIPTETLFSLNNRRFFISYAENFSLRTRRKGLSRTIPIVILSLLASFLYVLFFHHSSKQNFAEDNTSVTLPLQAQLPMTNQPMHDARNNHTEMMKPNREITPQKSPTNSATEKMAMRKNLNSNQKNSDSKFDPVRCQPIVKRFQSSAMSRFAKSTSETGDWYVCR
jgi:hypothetical protein